VSRKFVVGVGAVFCCLSAACGTGNPSVTSLTSWESQAATDASNGQCANAVRLYSEVLDQDSSNVNAFSGRGKCFLSLGEFGSAIDDLRTASKLSPDSANNLNLSEAYWQDGQVVQAERTLRLASQLSDPSDGPNELLTIAGIQESYAVYADARATLNRIMTASRNYQWYLTLGEIDAATGSVTSVNHDLAMALSLAPDSDKASTLSTIGDTWFDQSQYQSALLAYTQSLSATGTVDWGYAYDHIGQCYERLGQNQNALMAYEKEVASGASGTDLQSAELSIARTEIALGQLQHAKTILAKLARENLPPALAAQLSALQGSL
jgi:tetratricopeptide (TPR) repeat protein